MRTLRRFLYSIIGSEFCNYSFSATLSPPGSLQQGPALTKARRLSDIHFSQVVKIEHLYRLFFFNCPPPLVQYQNDRRPTSQPEALLDEGFMIQQLTLAPRLFGFGGVNLNSDCSNN